MGCKIWSTALPDLASGRGDCMAHLQLLLAFLHFLRQKEDMESEQLSTPRAPACGTRCTRLAEL